MIKIRHTTLSSIYFAMSMLLVALFMLMDMSAMEHGSTPLPGIGAVACLAAVCCMASVWKFFVISDYKAFRPNSTIAFYVVYFLWALVITITNDDSKTPMDYLVVVMRQTLPLLSLLLPYNYLRNHGDSKLFGWVLCILCILFGLHFFYIFSKTVLEILDSHPIVSYYTLYLLPAIILTCGKKRTFFFIIFTSIVLIASIKRSGIATLAVALLVYLLVFNFMKPKFKFGTMLGSLIVIGIFAGMIVFIGDSDENNLIERFENVQDDEGSGRTMVWAKTYQLIENSDFEQLIIGHGYNTVARDSILGISAHNDFLEVIYDFGIVGLVLYLLALFSFLRYATIRILRKSPYSPALAMLATIYIILTLPSHIIIYPWACIIMFTISYIFGREKLDEEAAKAAPQSINEDAIH